MNKSKDYKQSNLKCKKCHENFVYFPDETWWDFGGFGYITKLTKCPCCGNINVIEHKEDTGLDVNNDKRFYEYK